MSFSDFQKEAKQKLAHYQPELDVDAFWDELEPHVPKKKEKKRFFFWLSFGVLLLLILIGYFLINKSPEHSITQPEAIAENGIGIPSNGIQKMRNPGFFEEKGSVGKDAIVENEKLPASAEVKEAFRMLHSNVGQKRPLKTTKNIKPTTSDFTPINREKLEHIASINAPISPKNATAAFAPLALKTMQLTSTDLLVEPDFQLTGEEGDQKEFARKKWQWSIGAQGAWQFANQQLSSNAASTLLMKAREKSETPLEEIAARLYLQLRHHSGFYFGAGLEYARIASRFDYHSISTDSIFDPKGIQRIYTNTLTAESSRIYGPVYTVQTTERNFRRFNYFHTINLPVFAGYRMEKGRFFFGVEAGLLINAQLNSKGTILQEEQEFYDLEQDGNHWFKNTVSLRPMISTPFGLTLRNGLEIYAAPSYRFPVKISEQENPIQSSFSSLGIALGMQYNF